MNNKSMYLNSFHMQTDYRRSISAWIISVACILYCSTGYSETVVDFYGRSHHPGDGIYTYKNETRPYNNRNWGIGIVQKVWGPFYAIGGAFKNSYYKPSEYLGVEFLDKFTIPSSNKVKLTYGLRAFYITGYDNTKIDAEKYLRAGFFVTGIEYKKARFNYGFNEEATVVYLSYILKREKN